MKLKLGNNTCLVQWWEIADWKELGVVHSICTPRSCEDSRNGKHHDRVRRHSRRKPARFHSTETPDFKRKVCVKRKNKRVADHANPEGMGPQNSKEGGRRDKL